MGGRRWTPQEIGIAEWDRYKGVPATQTAQTLGKSLRAVYRFLERRRVPLVSRLAALWLHEFCGPHDLPEIARRRKTSESNVRRRKWELKRAGCYVWPLKVGVKRRTR